MEEEALLSSPALSHPQRLKRSLRAAGVSKTGQRHTLALPSAGARSSPLGGAHTAVPHETPSMSGWKEGYKTAIGVSIANVVNLIFVVTIRIYRSTAAIGLIHCNPSLRASLNYSRAAERMVAREYPCKDRQRLLLNEGILIRMAPCWQMTSRERP